MAVEITEYREFKKGYLIGFATFRLTNIGLEIRDCTVHEKDSKKWINLPSKPYEDKEGNKKYSYIVTFYDDGVWRKFQNAAMAALEPHLSKLEQQKPNQQTSNMEWNDDGNLPF